MSLNNVGGCRLRGFRVLRTTFPVWRAKNSGRLAAKTTVLKCWIVDVWLLPILGAIIHHAWAEIEHHLD
ncbi:hypothetical protein [Xenorhabdus nematophila]|uniref:hypothetical protein n=1 Tax=Xenorhabdus nematophila TaxID=628 RepID=UPI0018CA7EA4|nr:hypothetical protein [Xenorhabdus nematophila]